MFVRLRKHLLLLAAGRVKLILRCIKAAAARLWQGLGWADLGWIKCPKRERPVIHNERPDPHPVIQLYFAKFKHKLCQLMRFNCNFKVVVMELLFIFNVFRQVSQFLYPQSSNSLGKPS